MFGIKTSVGIAAIGLFALAVPTSASGLGQPASTGNLGQPSMVTDGASHQHVVARRDTGIWYITDQTGDFVRTRMTQDFTSKVNGQTVNHAARSPFIAINAGGTLTAVYSIRVTPGSCASQGIFSTVRSGSSWSTPTSIPNASCETATGLVVHGSKIYLATIHGHQPGLVLHQCLGLLDARNSGDRSPHQPSLALDIRRQADARLHHAQPSHLRARRDQHRKLRPRDCRHGWRRCFFGAVRGDQSGQ